MLLQTSSGTSTKFRTFLHLSDYHIGFTFESHRGGLCKKPCRKRHYIAMLLTKPHWFKSTFCYFLHNRWVFLSFNAVEGNVLEEWHCYEISWSPSYLYPHILKAAFGAWFMSGSSTTQAAAAVIWSHSSVSLSSFPSSAGGDSQAIHPKSCW